MSGQDVVGQDLGRTGGDVQQTDGALDGIRGQGRARTSDVDELGQEQDDDIDPGFLAGDGDGRTAHMNIDVRKSLLNGAQDLIASPQKGNRRQIRRQDQTAGRAGRSGGAEGGTGRGTGCTGSGCGAARGSAAAQRRLGR